MNTHLTVPLITLAIACQCEANLLVNGSFESPGLQANGLHLPNGSSLVTGWVVVDNVPDATAYATVGYMQAPYFGLFPAADGDYFLWIDNNNYAGGATLNGVYQDFVTEVGQKYRVTFDAATELAFGVDGLLQVSAGDTVRTFNLPNPGGYPDELKFSGWQTYTFTFTAQNGVTRLQFFDLGVQVGGNPLNGNSSPLLDNVKAILVGETEWGKFAKVNGNHVDTGNWLGWLEVSNAPWVYSYNEGHYLYIPQEVAEVGRGWIYAP